MQDRARNDGQHAGERHRALGIAAGQWQDDAQDHRRQRGVRPQHQDPARTEQRIDQQRNDGRVEAINARHAGRHGVGDPHRDQHRRQHQPGHEIMPEPCRLVAQESTQSRQPAPPPGALRHPAVSSVPVEIGFGHSAMPAAVDASRGSGGRLRRIVLETGSATNRSLPLARRAPPRTILHAIGHGRVNGPGVRRCARARDSPAHRRCGIAIATGQNRTCI